MALNLNDNLRHPDLKIRRGAVIELLNSNSSQKKETLEELIRSETNARLQFVLKSALNNLNSLNLESGLSSAITEIKKQLNSANLEDHKVAARSILRHQLEQFLPDLLQRKDEDSIFSLTALHLMRKNKTKYFDCVRKFLLDQRYKVVMRALDVLMDYGHTSALTLCLQNLDHADPRIKNYIRARLILLGHNQLNFLFTRLLQKQHERFDLLVFRSALNLRFKNLHEVLNIIQTRAKGEFSKQIEELLCRFEKSEAAPVESLNNFEKQLQKASSIEELIPLIHSISQSEMDLNAKLTILMKFLSHPDSEIKLACLEALVKLAPDDLVSLFQQFLNDDNPSVRSTAILALSQHPALGPVYRDEITLSLKSMIDLGNRDALLTALSCIGNLSDKNHIPLVYEILELAKKDIEIHDTAHEVLDYININAFESSNNSSKSKDTFEQLSESAFINKLEEALIGDDIDHKVQLLKGLTQFEVIRYSESVNKLLYRLRESEEEPKVLSLMLRNLGLYQHQKSSEFLLEYLQHPNLEVKAAALKSLSYYQDSRVLITYMELLNESWKSPKPLILMDEIIEYIFLKRPDLAITAIEKLAKIGRSQEERLRDWLSHCNSCSMAIIQLLNSWFDEEFSEPFLDYICELMCHLLKDWDIKKVAPLLLNNPHQSYRNKFIQAFDTLKSEIDDTKVIKNHSATSETEISNISPSESKEIKDETIDTNSYLLPEETNNLEDQEITVEIQEESSLTSKEQDSVESYEAASNTSKSNTTYEKPRRNHTNLIQKILPYISTCVTGLILAINLYQFAFQHYPKIQSQSTTSEIQTLQPSLIPTIGSTISDKFMFLKQVNLETALLTWKGFSVMMLLSEPQWLKLAPNTPINITGRFQNQDALGNLILYSKSF